MTEPNDPSETGRDSATPATDAGAMAPEPSTPDALTPDAMSAAAATASAAPEMTGPPGEVAAEAATDDSAGIPPVPPAPSGWIPPGPSSGSGRPRGCCLIVAVVTAIGAVLLVVLLVGLIFLGSQVRSILGGTVQFGTGGSNCTVTGMASTFPASATIHFVAFLERDVRAGETVTVTVTYPDGTSESSDESYATAGACVYEDIQPGLTPGHYIIEFRAGSEFLSRGGFEITP